VIVSAGLPVVLPTGGIEVWHPSCWTVRVPQRTPPPLPVVARPRRSMTTVVALAACGALAFVVGNNIWFARHYAAASLAAVDLEPVERVKLREQLTVRDQLAEAPTERETIVASAYPIPERDGRRLDELFPSLHDWTHPVTSTPELMPTQASRLFGADRASLLPSVRPECGAGHCGVDLDGPRGRPIVAVADGIVVRLELHELGLDGRSGRFVKLEHDDGTLTAYMHLDDVAELHIGERVSAGQVIGTLGASAVFEAAPHCHFTLEVPNHPGRHGDNTDTRYLDPAPFLVRATVAPRPARAPLMHAL
jgi:murein DD-endopeptidase MepM/ murein hydrolase activator NlpD